MIDNDSLRQALGRLERHAPAEADVLAGMRAGIARRRRRRQVASVAGVAGAASAVALGVVLVAPDRGNDQGSGPPPTAPPSTSVNVAVPPAPPALPFSVGWLPDGYRLNTWSAGSTGGIALYNGTKDFGTVGVGVSAEPYDPAEGDTEEPTEIAGRPGVVRLSPDPVHTQLIWQRADGRWVAVSGRASTVPLATLRKVAEGLSSQPTPMAVSLGLKAVPEGYAHANWAGDGPMIRRVTLCRTEIDPRGGTLGADCIRLHLQGNGPADELIPVDQEQVVNGVLTWASANGEIVYARLDAEHWVNVWSEKAGVDLLRAVASNVILK